MFQKKYQAVVIGVSAGGMQALTELFSKLNVKFPIPIIVVQHFAADQNLEFLMNYYENMCCMKVKEAEEKIEIENGVIYFAPPNYHLLIESDRTFSLSSEERVNYSRPSIDVLFSSAAAVYFDSLIGIVLTGANSDGTEGAKDIKANGGLVIAQDPREAQYPAMPGFVINNVKVDKIMKIGEIAAFLNELALVK